MTKKNAFTLAELLITLVIIGVIAALTIPAVMFSTDEKQAAAGLKKAMMTLNQAVDMARTEIKFQPNPKCYIDPDGDSDTSQCEDLFKYMKNIIQVQIHQLQEQKKIKDILMLGFIIKVEINIMQNIG